MILETFFWKQSNPLISQICLNLFVALTKNLFHETVR